MTDKITALIEAYKVDRDEQRVIAQRRTHEVVSTIFAEIPQLKFIRLRGWTPGFNDGDPCCHRMDVAIDSFDPDDIFYEHFSEENSEKRRIDGENDPRIGLFVKKDEIKSSVWDSELRQSIALPLDDFDKAVIKAAGLLQIMADDFEILHGTDWQLDVIRDVTEENGYSVTHEDYECGH